MRFVLDPATERFRDDVKRFLDVALGLGGAAGDPIAFQRQLAARGWLTLAWPKEFGGAGASHLHQLVYNEEMAYADAPFANHGVNWVGPTLMLYGSDEQKARYLPRIASGEEHWCTLYSEPGAGSDLASLRTRAVADGDDFVIDGQKIWTGRAHLADFGWLAARTDPAAPKHQGISLIMVDMKSPGVSVRPLLDLSGRHHFNEVFFEGVRVPRANVVGAVNRGWYHIAVALDFERSGIQNFAVSRRGVEQLVSMTQSQPRLLCGRSHLRHEIAERAIEVAVGTNLAYRVALMQANGEMPNHESSASRVFGTELVQRVAQTALRVTGLAGQLRGGCEPRPDFATGYLLAASETIAGGTSEIQRNIIATRGLGLPRG
ncbi:MAG: acyl-CoA dehydrogenase family protein [Chloroflexi bacterium]|nr:acyl-CoA dehydrogenase family protein [Chloroflexota bacterium]